MAAMLGPRGVSTARYSSLFTPSKPCAVHPTPVAELGSAAVGASLRQKKSCPRSARCPPAPFRPTICGTVGRVRSGHTGEQALERRPRCSGRAADSRLARRGTRLAESSSNCAPPFPFDDHGPPRRSEPDDNPPGPSPVAHWRCGGGAGLGDPGTCSRHSTRGRRALDTPNPVERRGPAGDRPRQLDHVQCRPRRCGA